MRYATPLIAVLLIAVIGGATLVTDRPAVASTTHAQTPAPAAGSAQLLAAPTGPRPVLAPAPSLPGRTAWPPVGEALRAVGLPVGDHIDPGDVVRAAAVLGVAVGTSLEPGDVARVAARARRSLAPVMWVLAGDYGATVDQHDLLGAAARLGLDVGQSVDATDLARIRTAAARTFANEDRRLVSPGLAYERWTATVDGGHAAVHVLRWQLTDPRVRLRPETTGAWGTKGTIPDVAARRAERGAVAVVNGGFWADGDMPDGLFVSGGRMLSDPTIGKPWVRGPRGTFALLDHLYAVGRPAWTASLTIPGIGELPVRGVNRPLRGDDVVVYSRAFGPDIQVPAAVTLPGIALSTTVDAGAAAGPVASGRVALPEHGVVVAASGEVARVIERVTAGQQVSLRIATPSWEQAREALAGGPLLIADGVRTTVPDWQSEGFGPRHNAVRHPRTALGFTREREAILVVVDGRQPGYSVGMTTAETGALMRSLGAWDALMLDGGGSSHMVLTGTTVNRPCCDGRPRPVPTALVLYGG